jgi:SAM-dependent methyltransferase
MKCRHCQAPLSEIFIDLGSAPASNAFLRPEQLDQPEMHFPLKVFTCGECRLVQMDEVQRHDALFSDDYVYFSSYSSSWVEHARQFVSLAAERLSLDERSLVLEIASNDGYLLQHVRARGVPCVGIEPTASTAQAARSKQIECIEAFFSREFACRFVAQRQQADLIIGNNVLAHVPDINDFVAGLAVALAPQGCITMEFPHLLQLVQHGQFDTIYHEHFSYLSFGTVQRIFAAQDLCLWDVETLPTHGGSLRIWAQHADHKRQVHPRVAQMLDQEARAGANEVAFYHGLQTKAHKIKNDLLAFLIDQRRAGKTVVAYGAAAKGNTLLNYAGIRPDLLPYVVDASPHKQGRFLPGSRIPVVDENELQRTRPDFVLILPWNLRQEITAQLNYVRKWGGQFVTAVPDLELA